MTPRRALPSRRGYSLVEVLASISIIAVIAATAIPSVGKINDSSKDAVHKRNAQNFASVSLSAQAAGLDFVTTDNVEEAMENIINGGQVEKGAFDGAYFGIPGISDTERAEAAKFLKIENGMLVYTVMGDSDISISDPPVSNDQPGISLPVTVMYNSDPIPVSVQASVAMPATVLETSISLQFYQTIDSKGNTWNHQITKTYVGDELTNTESISELSQ